MRSVREAELPIILPTLVIPEIAAAIGRGQGLGELGHAFAIEVSRFPHVTLISLDESLAESVARIAAVYAAVAARFATELVTTDPEQFQRLEKTFPVRRVE